MISRCGRSSAGPPALTFCLSRSVQILLSLYLLSCSPPVKATEIKFGILSVDAVDDKWGTTFVDYLTANFATYASGNVDTFSVTTVPFVNTKTVAKDKTVNSCIVTEFSGQPVVSLVNKRQGQVSTRFGAVILARRDNEAIDEDNLSTFVIGKKFGAVDVSAFGGFLMAASTVTKDVPGGSLFSSPETVTFLKGHAAVVKAILSGDIDSGTVRTDILEKMAAAGTIPSDIMSTFKIYRTQAAREEQPGFPFILSTELFPEWPLVALPHVDYWIQEGVAETLLAITSSDDAASDGGYERWNLPFTYEKVHDALEDARVLNITTEECLLRTATTSAWDVVVCIDGLYRRPVEDMETNCGSDEPCLLADNCLCKPCLACPTGATCAGGQAEPVAVQGWWSDPEDITRTFYECSPGRCETNANGEVVCLRNFEGQICSRCSDSFFNLKNSCLPCWHSNLGVAVFLFVVWIFFLLGVGVALSYLTRPRRQDVTIQVFLVLLQLQIFTSLNFYRTDGAVATLEGLTSFLYMIVSLLATASAIEGLVYLYEKRQQKLVDEQRPPNRGVSTEGEDRPRTSRRSIDLSRMSSVIGEALTSNLRHRVRQARLLSARFSFIPVLYRFASIGDCFEQPSGFYSLRDEPSLECFESEWNRSLALTIVGLTFFAVVMPLFIFFTTHTFKDVLSATLVSDPSNNPSLKHPTFGNASLKKKTEQMLTVSWIFLTDFVQQYRFWWLVICARDTALAVSFLAAPDMSTRLVVTGFILLAYVLGLLILGPFRTNHMNNTEAVLSSLNLMASVLLLSIASSSSESSSSEERTSGGLRDSVDYLLFSLFFCFLLALGLIWFLSRKSPTFRKVNLLNRKVAYAVRVDKFRHLSVPGLGASFRTDQSFVGDLIHESSPIRQESAQRQESSLRDEGASGQPNTKGRRVSINEGADQAQMLPPVKEEKENEEIRILGREMETSSPPAQRMEEGFSTGNRAKGPEQVEADGGGEGGDGLMEDLPMEDDEPIQVPSFQGKKWEMIM
uniref:Solute-binding protein family 3/N-terminal domain-containing protein n=1 Tax=Chromera velia CCMP2878 TaxID=1169474 RepID=A0A0G4FME1_9ALVE|eukprot:Cvel_3514.t1-p1 / transcript=Cvel_3514.t1 / gene=Cvel_3514 / organism=Chromera_velia_CCMP2878 / gene_product=hypothetical protein / transcript_product=hypothetical protein / location=Cvel_scaffold142:91517-100748(+) / protein_length=1018 / sequence_SO=supercontig / SO=protein_coding / is_pseudo=false